MSAPFVILFTLLYWTQIKLEASKVTKIVGVMLLLIAGSGLAMASGAPVPEIDPGMAGTALALLSGALLILRGRRKR